MNWKVIGKSVAGTSHAVTGRPCEDSLEFIVIRSGDEDVLVACGSDGAGSAIYGGDAATLTVKKVTDALGQFAKSGREVKYGDVYAIMEDIYEYLDAEAKKCDVDISEFSCTVLGVYITNSRAVFFQIGDGAIARNDGSGYFTPIWWPMNGEYQNTTSFVTDDPTFSQLRCVVLEERVDEVALFTDGLQLLALNTEEMTVHQPFFEPLFKYLRLADEPAKLQVLDRKLGEYLDSKPINDRTDDDKTLFLATRL